MLKDCPTQKVKPLMPFGNKTKRDQKIKTMNSYTIPRESSRLMAKMYV